MQRIVTIALAVVSLSLFLSCSMTHPLLPRVPPNSLRARLGVDISVDVGAVLVAKGIYNRAGNRDLDQAGRMKSPEFKASMKRIRLAERRSLPGALAILKRYAGIRKLPVLLLKLVSRSLSKNTWQSVEPPGDERDILSRRQMDAAVVLYRLLVPVTGEKKALECLEEIVLAGSIEFIRIVFGDIKTLVEITHSGDPAKFDEVFRYFVNAEYIIRSFSSDTAAVDITRCRFVELSQKLGLPELAPLFCRGDEIVFNAEGSPVHLTRKGTLASGASRCDFRFTLRKTSPRGENPCG